ncbi:MAG: hypothetical protein JOZ27_03385 [Caulobacteraceae bacterium]|nr:hypothetical protein [Caulobacteraceae bacterium]
MEAALLVPVERGYRRAGMADEPDNLVLQLLRRMDTTLARVAEDLHDAKVRLTHVADALADVIRRLEGVEARTERIERRLDLVQDAR